MMIQEEKVRIGNFTAHIRQDARPNPEAYFAVRPPPEAHIFSKMSNLLLRTHSTTIHTEIF